MEVLRNWENYLVNKDNRDYVSVVVRVPYCIQACTYCKYMCEVLRDYSQIDEWLTALNEEMKKYKSIFKNYKMDGVYLCGGTVSLFKNDQLSRLVDIVLDNFNINFDGTWRHLEVSVEHLTDKKIDFYKKLPININRLGVGVQSLNNEILDKYNRFNILSKKEKLEMLKFVNASFDFSYIEIINLYKESHTEVKELLNAGMNKVFFYNLLNHSDNSSGHNIKYYTKTEFDQFKNNYRMFEITDRELKFVKHKVPRIHKFISPNPVAWNSELAFGALAKSFIIPNKVYYVHHLNFSSINGYTIHERVGSSSYDWSTIELRRKNNKDFTYLFGY